MAEKLTIEQQLAVSDRGGKLLVSAAAGSGGIPDPDRRASAHRPRRKTET